MKRQIIRINENDLYKLVEKSVKRILKEGKINNPEYTHYAINKATNKIVNGWDYSDYDPVELRLDRKYYFIQDLIDYELNPKDYKILTTKMLMKMGIDPNDDNNWANS